MKVGIVFRAFFVILFLSALTNNSLATAASLSASPSTTTPGTPVNFTYSNPGTSECLVWNFADGSGNITESISTIPHRRSHTFSEIGTFQVKVWDQACDYGGPPTASATVIVRESGPSGTAIRPPSKTRPIKGTFVVKPDKRPKVGTEVTFIPKGLKPRTCIKWDFGDKTKIKSTSSRVTHTYKNPGTYTATMYGGCGKKASAKTTLRVLDLDRKLRADKTRVNVGDKVNFTAKGFIGKPCILWKFNGKHVKRGGARESHTFSEPGSHVVKAYDKCKGSIRPESVQIRVTDRELLISKVDLLFNNNKQKADVKIGDPLSAKATFYHKGKGTVRFQWLLGNQVFGPVQSLRLHGLKRKRTISKLPLNLPTAKIGQYTLTLRLLKITPTTRIGSIDYSVEEQTRSLAQMPGTLIDFEIKPRDVLSGNTTLHYHLQNIKATLYHIRFNEKTFPGSLSCTFKYSQLKKYRTIKQFNSTSDKGTLPLKASGPGYIDCFYVEGANKRALWFLWMSHRLKTGGSGKNPDGSWLYDVSTPSMGGVMTNMLGATRVTYYYRGNNQPFVDIWEKGEMSMAASDRGSHDPNNVFKTLCRSDGSGITGYSDKKGGSIVSYPDGSKGVINKDGSEHWEYADGSKTIISKGGLTLTHYDKNGRVVYKLPYYFSSYYKNDDRYYSTGKDGGKTIYVTYKGKIYYKEKTVYPDGSVIYYDLDDKITGYSAENCAKTVGKGPTSKRHGNGSITYYNKGGLREYSTHPDGKKTYYTVNGDSSTKGNVAFTQDKDGKKQYRKSAGGSVKKHDGTDQPCGSKTYDPDGSETCWFMGMKVLTVHPDGSTTYYTPWTGKKSYTENKDKTRTYYKNGKIWYTQGNDQTKIYYRNGKKWYRENKDGSRTYYDRDEKEWYTIKQGGKQKNLPPDSKDTTSGKTGQTPEQGMSGLWNQGLPDPDEPENTLPKANLNQVSQQLLQGELPTGFRTHTTLRERGLIPESRDYDTDTPSKDTHYYNSKNEKIYTRHPDGSITYYNSDGKKWYTEKPDGSVLYYDQNNEEWYGVHQDGTVNYPNTMARQDQLPTPLTTKLQEEFEPSVAKILNDKKQPGTTPPPEDKSDRILLKKPTSPSSHVFRMDQDDIGKQIQDSLPVDQNVKKPDIGVAGVPQISYFYFDPTEITLGDKTKLYYKYMNGGSRHGDIEDPDDPGRSLVNFTGKPQGEGVLELTPKITQNYHMLVSGSTDDQGNDYKMARIIVRQPKGTWDNLKPLISKFSASPASIKKGETSQLVVEYTHISDAGIYDKDTGNRITTLPVPKAGKIYSFSVPVKPERTTNYELRAENRNGKVKKTTVVSMTAAGLPQEAFLGKNVQSASTTRQIDASILHPQQQVDGTQQEKTKPIGRLKNQELGSLPFIGELRDGENRIKNLAQNPPYIESFGIASGGSKLKEPVTVQFSLRRTNLVKNILIKVVVPNQSAPGTYRQLYSKALGVSKSLSYPIPGSVFSSYGHYFFSLHVLYYDPQKKKDDTETAQSDLVIKPMYPAKITAFSAVPDKIIEWGTTTFHIEGENIKEADLFDATNNQKIRTVPLKVTDQTLIPRGSGIGGSDGSGAKTGKKLATGSTELKPVKTFSYYVVAKRYDDPGKTVKSKTIKVEVKPRKIEIREFSAKPNPVTKGNTPILTYYIANATTATIYNCLTDQVLQTINLEKKNKEETLTPSGAGWGSGGGRSGVKTGNKIATSTWSVSPVPKVATRYCIKASRKGAISRVRSKEVKIKGDSEPQIHEFYQKPDVVLPLVGTMNLHYDIEGAYRAILKCGGKSVSIPLKYKPSLRLKGSHAFKNIGQPQNCFIHVYGSGSQYKYDMIQLKVHNASPAEIHYFKGEKDWWNNNVHLKYKVSGAKIIQITRGTAPIYQLEYTGFTTAEKTFVDKRNSRFPVTYRLNVWYLPGASKDGKIRETDRITVKK